MRKSGLEWAHRMYRDPASVGRRYLVDGLPYAASLLGKAAVKRLAKILKGPDQSPAADDPASVRHGRRSTDADDE